MAEYKDQHICSQLVLVAGDTAENISVGENGKLHISDGGYAYNTNVSGFGQLEVAGGVAEGGIAGDYGRVNVCENGTLKSMQVSGADCHFSVYGIAENISVENGGFLFITVYDNGVASVIENGGYVEVMEGGPVNFVAHTVDGITIGSYATVHANTVFENVEILPDGTLDVCGGIARNVSLAENADGIGTLYISDGGLVEELTVTEKNTGIFNAPVRVSGGGTLKNAIVDHAAVSVLENGTASDVTLQNNGTLIISGGVVSGVDVTETGGKVDVSGGSAVSAVVAGGGIIQVRDGGIVLSTTIKNGELQLYNGTASETIVSSFGNMDVYDSAFKTNIAGGFVKILSKADEIVMSGGTLVLEKNAVVSNVEVSDGHVAVSSGGKLADVLFCDGELVVSNCGILENADCSGGFVSFEAGATANNVKVSGNASCYIALGAVATIQENGGYVSVADNADVTFIANTFRNFIQENNGSTTIHNGTVAENFTVGTYGLIDVYSGGSVKNVSACSEYANISIRSGGSADTVRIENNGSICVDYNASVRNAVFAKNGSGNIWGKLTDAQIMQGGTVSIYGNAENVAVNAGGNVYVEGKATIQENGGYVSVAGNADVTFIANTFRNFIQENNGSTTIHSGTVSDDFTLGENGLLQIFSDGLVQKVAAVSNGTVRIDDGGIASGVDIKDKSQLNVSSGGLAEKVVVYAGGSARVEESGTVRHIKVNRGGLFTVYGSAEIVYNPWQTGVTSAAGAEITYVRDVPVFYGNQEKGIVRSGRVLDQLSVEANYSAVVFDTGRLDRANIYGTVSLSGGSAYDAVVNAGNMTVESGGIVNTVLVQQGAVLSVCSDGNAFNVTENGGAVLAEDGANITFVENTVQGLYVADSATVHKNTVAKNICVQNGGTMTVYSGGSGIDVIVEQGGSLAVSGGKVQQITVSAGGNIFVASDGTAEIYTDPWRNIRIESETGATVEYIHQAAVYYGNHTNGVLRSGNVMQGLNIANGMEAFVYSGGKISNTRVNGTVHVSQGGVAVNTVLGQYGRIYVASGGFADGVTVSVNGSIEIASGGSAGNVTGSFYLAPGAVYNGSSYKRGMLYNAVYSQTGVRSYVEYDTNVLNATVHSGAYVICGWPESYPWIDPEEPGCGMESTTVKSGGTLEVLFGSAGNTILEKGAVMNISGGRVDTLEVAAGARTDIVSGGMVQAADISGTLYVSDNGILKQSTVSAGGTAYILNKGIAADISVAEYGNLYIDMAGCCENISVSGGAVHVATGGSVSDVSVSGGGFLYLYGGAVLDGTINVEGTVKLDDAAVNRGSVNFVLNRENAASAMINDLSLLSGGTLSVTVDGSESCEYVLSECVAGFNGSIAVKDRNGNAGIITLERDAIVNNMSYSLDNNNGKLIVKAVVKDTTAPEITITPGTTAPTREPIILSATFSDDNQIVLKQYRLNGGAWQDYTGCFTVSANMKVDFRAKDVAGNITEKSYTVSNIDTVAPEKPAASANITSLTNKDVTVSATFSSDSRQKQYSLDGKNWKEYTKGIVFSANGSVCFRGIDAAGNISEITEYKVGNIDKTAPEKPAASADITTATHGKVTVSATFSSDSKQKQYSLDGKNWKEYTKSIVFSANGSVYFRGIDAAGNISAVTEYKVSNIAAAVSSSLVNLYQNNKLISAGKILSGKNLTAGWTMHVSKGGTASNNSLINKGSIVLSSGGVAKTTVINSKGALHVYSGAVASNTTVNQDGYFGVGNGAVTYDTTLGYAGKLTVWNGGKVYRNTLNKYGALILSSGAIADSSVVNANGGLHVYSGAFASHTTVKQSGYLGVGLGATTYDTVIDYAGKLTVWGGGTAIGNTIGKYGNIILSSGAKADKSVINAQGGLHVYSGAVASNTTVKQSGYFGVGRGAKAYNTVIDYAGKLTVWGGGAAYDNTIHTYGAIILSSGAVASKTLINAKGGLHIYKGAVASAVTVASGANLGVGGGGKLVGGTVNYGAGVTFYKDSILAGSNTFAGTAKFNAKMSVSGINISIDISSRKTTDSIVIDNVANVAEAIFNVKAASNQSAGRYLLAGGASSFSGSLSLCVGNACYGSLSIGKSITAGGRKYTLGKSGSTLFVDVANTASLAYSDTAALFVSSSSLLDTAKLC